MKTYQERKMSFTVVGIGELLWDVFPERRRMGGAPVNFACICSQLGARGIPVSCVGDDEAGTDILKAVRKLGLATDFILTRPGVPTGTVNVVLDANYKPRYEIMQGVAWDCIQLNDPLRRLAAEVDAVCFGSLAQRGEVSRDAIQSFVRLCPDKALKLFDVNLRQSFFSKPVIESSLGLANVLKVSDEELPVLAGLFDLKGSAIDQIWQLISRFNLRLVAYTRGADGSVLVTADSVIEHPGFKPNAVDTVGAGDSYTATLCMGLLSGYELGEIIQHAGKVAAFVCEQPGATPVLPESLHLERLEPAGEGNK